MDSSADADNFKQYILPPPNPAANAVDNADNGGNLVDFGDDFADLTDPMDPAANGNTNRYHNGDLLLALLYSAKLRF